MILDKENLCDEDHALTAVGSSWSTDVIDMGSDSSKIQQFVEKAGEMFCQVTTDFDSVGDASRISVTVYVSDSSTMAAGNVWIAHSGQLLEASLVAGYKFTLGKIPAHLSKRYLAFYYTVHDEAMTSGKLTSGIVIDAQTAGMQPL